MAKPRNWILVADPSKARLFENVGFVVKGKWKLIEEFEYPDGRAKLSELFSDRPGRVRQSGAPDYRSAMGSRSQMKRVIWQRFAKILAQRIDLGLNANAFDRLILVAPPSFMGVLREKLSPRAMRHVTAAIEKDYRHFEDRQLEEQLNEQHISS